VLLLFDVDGTLLLRAAEAHKQAFHVALREVYGIEDATPFRVATPGKTDLQIAREVLLQAGFDARAIDDRIDALGEAWCRAHAERQPDIADRVAPGMRELLDWLAADGRFRLSLLTGNLEPIARLKLHRAGIGEFFPRGQGAFGSDSEDRAELPALARRRAGRPGDAPHPRTQTAVIGDTPLDIACARADGVRALAVATGPYRADELRAADEVAADASGLRAVLDRLG
jgi:phosphoglycolate phosphatase-like HAD superfamily hydrolase